MDLNNQANTKSNRLQIPNWLAFLCLILSFPCAFVFLFSFTWMLDGIAHGILGIQQIAGSIISILLMILFSSIWGKAAADEPTHSK